MIRFTLLTYMLLNVLFVSGQDAEQVVRKMQEYYQKESYSLQMEYKTYATYSAKDAYLKYDAFLLKSKNDAYYKIHNTEIICIDTDVIKIAHDQKMVQYSQVDKTALDQITSPLDIEKILPYFVKKEVKETSEGFHCTFYTSQITQLPYAKLELVIDKTRYALKKQVLYFNQVKKYKTTNGEIKTDYPRLEIVCFPIDTRIDKQKVELSSYLQKRNDKVVLSKKYAQYQLVN
ncbi:MAG: hypothetical protein HRT68_12900 [Flavobacteriaceae bacterium]|nr:hypothetical protein [Flavobacteriaceae bacterium]